MKSFAVNEAMPLVLPSAAASPTDSEPAEKESGDATEAADTTPDPLAYSIEFERPASVSAPVELNELVAVPPKYAVPNTESCVVEAPAANC